MRGAHGSVGTPVFPGGPKAQGASRTQFQDPLYIKSRASGDKVFFLESRIHFFYQKSGPCRNDIYGYVLSTFYRTVNNEQISIGLA